MSTSKEYYEFYTIVWKFFRKFLEQNPINWDEYHEERQLIIDQYGDNGFAHDLMVSALTEIERVKA